MKHLFFIGLIVLSGCIGDDFIDDFVQPELRFTEAIDTLGVNTTFQLGATFFNNVGLPQNVTLNWQSSDPSVISVSPSGLIEGLKLGNATIEVEYDNSGSILKDSRAITVGERTVTTTPVRRGSIQSTSSYLLKGDFTLKESGSTLILEISDNYEASTSLPGLYVYFSNNKNSISDAFEIGEVETFDGAHTYNVSNIGINDFNYLLYYCKPFNVKVGDGKIN